MREQAIGQKVGNRSGLGNHRRANAATQRPLRRESGAGALVARFRSILGYVPAFLKLALAIGVGILVFAGYRAAASASFFQVRKVEVQGTSRISAEDVQGLVRKEVGKTGVWNADLKAVSTRLEKLPWIRTAVVSRVLPDGIRVRVTERVPRAVVRTTSGRFRWVDDDAVLLGEMLPTDQIPPFFMRGLNEEDPETGSADNRERVSKFLELQRDWDASGLSERISEVNLIDVRDIRAQLAGADSHIEIRLGSEDHNKRLKDALEVLDAQKQSARGSLISYIDLSQGNKRAIVGLTSGARASDNAVPSHPTTAVSEKTAERNTTGATPSANVSTPISRNAASNTRKARTDRSTATEKKTNKDKKSDRNR